MAAARPALWSGSLPIPRTRLIGRDHERASVIALLLDETIPLVTLTGPGGVGKTRLALAIARELATRFADGAAFVPLASVADPALVPAAVAHALDVREESGRSIAERLLATLRDRHMLLALDNFEHLLPAAPFVADLLASCPTLTILATSRSTLGVSGEQRFPVPPLNVPARAITTTAADVGQAEAVQLFVMRAKAAQPSFTLNDANAGDVAEICRRLDGLPLALELAAARIVMLAPSSLLAHLDRRLALLTGGPRDAPPRLRTMRDAIA
ncbi:MAG TPA: AAA family ATPase, partial [Thermomicrobiales bacterium]|nr:AAA family ATPase [Thermomicrobiales bacterium]